MSAMTMPFKLDDAVPIASMKPGDSIAFTLSAGNVISSVQPIASTAGASTGQGGGGHAMPGMPEMHSKSGMAMMDECREMMKRN